MNTYVYIGQTVTEAQSMAMVNRDRDKGNQVKLCTPLTSPSALLGLRIVGYAASKGAYVDPRTKDLIQICEQSKARS